jgi:flagellar hook-length control protein FliK
LKSERRVKKSQKNATASADPHVVAIIDPRNAADDRQSPVAEGTPAKVAATKLNSSGKPNASEAPVAEILPIDGEPQAKDAIAAQAAAAARASGEIGADNVTALETSNHTSKDAKLSKAIDKVPLESTDNTTTSAIHAPGQGHSTTTKEPKPGEKSPAAASAEAELHSHAAPTDVPPAPRRPRATKVGDDKPKSADEIPSTTAGAVDNSTDTKIADTASMTVLPPTPDLDVKTADPSGTQDAPAPQAVNPPDNTSSHDVQPTLPDKPSSPQLSRMGSSMGEKGPALSDVERVRFVQRVAKAFQSAADRGGPVRLRLSPPELGSLKLEITVRNGAMSARMEAETPAARTLLLEGLPALRDRLAQHDLKMERFDVDLMDQSPQNMPQPRDGAADFDRRGSAPAPRTRNQVAAEVSPVAATATLGPADGRLNVLI